MAAKVIKICYSYAHQDRTLRDELEKHLASMKRAGMIITWYDREIQPGKEWKLEINHHFLNADIILLLVSPDFIHSDYCYSIEMHQALELQEIGKVRVIPILIRPVDRQGTPLASLQFIPSNENPITLWSNQDEALDEVTQYIRGIVETLRETPLTGPFLPPRIWMVPSRNPFFTGREEVLTQLYRRFVTSARSLALSGLGGVGKSQIAIEYAYRHRSEYDFVLWVRASTRRIFFSHLSALAAVLSLSVKNEFEPKVVMTAIKHWLLIQSKWLLIVDDIYDLTLVGDLLPDSDTGHVLLTTRTQSTGIFALLLNVEKMNITEGATLLLKRAKIAAPEISNHHVDAQIRADAEAIVTELDGLPLALDQAGAYVEETKCNLKGYLALYRNHRRYLLRQRGLLPTDHLDSVATTFLLSFKKIKQANHMAADILSLCVFLAPDAISEEIIRADIQLWYSQIPHMLQPPLDIQLDVILRDLLHYSLMRRHPETHTLSIHRLVQVVLQDTMNQKMQRKWAKRAIQAVNQVITSTNAIPWPDSLDLLPHELVYAALIDDHGMRFSVAASLLAHEGFNTQEYIQNVDLLMRKEINIDITSASYEKMPISNKEIIPWMYTKLIVVVDDSGTVREIMKNFLTHQGFDVECFRHAMEAIRWFILPEARVPDLMFIDISLPGSGLDGFELIRHIKKKSQFRKTVIIMLTRHNGTIDRIKSRLVGAVGFMDKPFKTAEILSIVRSYLGLPITPG